MKVNIYTLIGLAGIIYIFWVGGGSITSGKPDQVVYVYEKDDGPIPRPVAGALMQLNQNETLGIEATEFEDDTVDSGGEVPDQYQVALSAAREAGLPALVVLSKGRVTATIKSPTTLEQVMDIVQ